MADKPGVAQYRLSRKVFTAELKSLRTCIGAGTLHTRYETITATAKYGGEASLYNIAFAVPRSGGLHPDLAAELTHLRALCVYKPDGSHRPLGLPESETRFFLACVAAQEKPAWDAFYTSPLPYDRAAQARDIEHAKEAVAHARAREAQAVACYQEGSPIDECCAAVEQVRDAEEALADAATPRNFPVNFAFSPNGCEALSHLVDGWHEADPTADTISDDIVSMYNETSLTAVFEAYRLDPDEGGCPHLIPVTRLIYGQPCPIWLERTSGPLRPASVTVDLDTVDPALSGLETGPWLPPGDASTRTTDGFLRACKGGHQGCPLATNQCIRPYHLSLHRTQRQHPAARIACQADDTYLNGHGGREGGSAAASATDPPTRPSTTTPAGATSPSTRATTMTPSTTRTTTWCRSSPKSSAASPHGARGICASSPAARWTRSAAATAPPTATTTLPAASSRTTSPASRWRPSTGTRSTSTRASASSSSARNHSHPRKCAAATTR